MEFEYESLAVRTFNRAYHKFKAWPIMILRDRLILEGHSGADVLFFVEPSGHDAMLPREDEVCAIDIPKFGMKLATRRENPCSLWKVRQDFWEKCLVFEVTLPYEDEKKKQFTTLTPLFLEPSSISKDEFIPNPAPGSYKSVVFLLRLSTSTRDAELDALDSLKKAGEQQLAQRRAFEYTMTFKSPKTFKSLFHIFPHMRDPILKPRAVPPKLVERFQTLNAMQMSAYKYLLAKIPDGICILPGGPGAGYVKSSNVPPGHKDIANECG